jgi:uncharacterized protein YjbJ (UPF0337 family)
VGRVPEVILQHRREPATLQHLSRDAEPGPGRPRLSAAAPRRYREGNIMDWTEIEGGWSDYHASAKQQWEKLSDKQIADTLGRREQLSYRLQEAYSLSRDESEREISEWQFKQAPAAKN